MSLDEPGARPPLSTTGSGTRRADRWFPRVGKKWRRVPWDAASRRWAREIDPDGRRFTPAVRAIWVAGLLSIEYTDEAFGEDW